MRAVQISETGGPEVLRTVELPEPHANPGQVRIAVRAAGINPIDWKIRAGLFPAPLPMVLGTDAAGVVDEVGEGVRGVAVGDEVFGFATTGAYAEYAVLSDWAGKPDSLTVEEAAGLPIAVETATRTLRQLGVGAGSVLLVNGAAGGVGLAAVQIALARGARVVGTASEANAAYLRSLGAVATTYGPGLVDRVRALVPRVDRALDTSGRGALPDLVALTGSADSVVTIADPAAQEHGVRFSSQGPTGEYRAAGALPEAVELIDAGRFHLPVARTYPLAAAADALRASEAGHVRGKLVLLV